MKGLFAIVAFSVFHGVVAVAGSSSADSQSAPPLLRVADGSVDAGVEIQDERLSVRFRKTPLGSVLRELSRATQATFDVHGDMPPTVTDAFEAVPLEKGLRRLFHQADVSLLYAGSERTRGAERRLVRVWIFARNPAAGSGPDATEQLEASILKAASAGSREERWQAVGELANSGDKGARDALLAAMRDPEPDVRERAIDALGDLRDEAAVGPLSRALTQDEDEDVRESAADALGEIPSAESVAALKRSLEDESPDVRESAVDGLARIGGPEIIPVLRGALSDEDEDVRDTAAESLRKLAGGGAGERSSGAAP